MQTHLSAQDDDMLYVITDGPMKIMKANTTIAATVGAPQMMENPRSEWTTEDKKKTNLDNVVKYHVSLSLYELTFRYTSIVKRMRCEDHSHARI